MKAMPMNSVHVIIGKRPCRHFSSMAAAVGSFQIRMVAMRLLILADEEIYQAARAVLFLPATK